MPITLKMMKLSDRPYRLTERAYAKINLYLDVRSKRADGFHELCTVMHSVSLADELALSLTRGEPAVSFHSNALFLPADRQNLAVEAAYRYMERTGFAARVRIDMKKIIPVAAGLAGGSSDAAAVLRAMNRANPAPIGMDALTEMAATLGSDVAYCLLGGTRLCLGRGELMTAVPFTQTLHAVIAIHRRERVSTPAAFGKLDAVYRDFDGSVFFRQTEPQQLAAQLSAGNVPLKDFMYNTFEEAILPQCPQAASFKAFLEEQGAYAAMMSGSGPSVFGLFASRRDAERAEKALKQAHPAAFAAAVRSV